MKPMGLVAILAVLLAASAAGQSLPKPRLPSSIPSNIPGASKLKAIPKTPGQVIREGKQEAVQELMQKALASEDPEEQARLYTEILLIDPNNTVAFQGRKDALDKIEKMKQEEAQRQAQQEEEDARRAKEVEESLAKETARRDALKKAENAFLAGNPDLAARHLEIAKRNARPGDPEVQSMEALVGKELEARKRRRYLLIGGAAGLGVVLLIVLIFKLRNRDPYIEILSGEGKGKKYPVDKDVLCIGAVPQDGAGKNDVVIRDVERMISRFHCELHRRGRKIYLIDCESANGTWVDRRPAPPNKPILVKSGAHIDLAGTCVLKLGYERRKKK